MLKGIFYLVSETEETEANGAKSTTEPEVGTIEAETKPTNKHQAGARFIRKPRGE